MGEIPSRLSEIPRDKEVVLYCEKGIRSVIAIQRLETLGFTNLINLAGGMKAWREAQ
jgi:rhodanese-related sulfurtransferase